MKAVCYTNAANPSQNLIKQICYPKSFVFRSKQTKWGCSHEELSRKRYEDNMTKSNEHFRVTDGGFIINSLAFSWGNPRCYRISSCCGDGVVKIKCPYWHREADVGKAAESKAHSQTKYMPFYLQTMTKWKVKVRAAMKAPFVTVMGQRNVFMITCDNEACNIEWFHNLFKDIQFQKESGFAQTAESYLNL